MKIKKLLNLVKKLIYILDTPQKVLCVLVFMFTLVGAVLECLGVSIIIPLVNVILKPDVLVKNEIIKKTGIAENWGYNGLVVSIVAVVILVYLFKNAFFIFLAWFRIKFSCKIQREVSIKMMKSYMSRGYQFFLDTNYGELARGVASDVGSVYNVLSAGFRLLSDVMAIVLICIYMFFTDYLLSLAVVAMAGFCVILIYFVFRRNMQSAGYSFRVFTANASQALYQAFQGIKDVMVLRKQKHFVKEYEKNMIHVQLAQCKQVVGGEAPAYIIEGICVSGIMAVVAYKIIMGGNTETFVATLAAFAIGAFRILPSLGRISVSINQVLTNTPSINAVYNDIREAEEYAKQHPEVKVFDFESDNDTKDAQKMFHDSITLDNVCFSYKPNSPIILDGIDFSVKKGQSVGIKGLSGAGKSTLVDVLLGLLVPQSGRVLLDGRPITDDPENWSNVISYVSQSIFLSDGSIRENVAFGCSEDEIDDREVIKALERAEMREFVEGLPEGINTYVGDRGIRLSGGQRQRIAIARALYHKPEILIMDEATSALDNETESAIMSAIDSLQGTITMIIVAHRLTTIKNCDVIYEVKDGKIFPVDKNSLFD